jgi:hypothetical protein
VKDASFQPVVNDDLAIFVPIKQLESIAAPVAKHEEVARMWIATQTGAYHLGQRIEALAEINRLGAEPNAHRGRQV